MMGRSQDRRWMPAIGVMAFFLVPAPIIAADEAVAPILVGLDADMSSSSAIGGEAIRRGAIIAIDEVNRAGGVLERSLELVIRDHRGNPDRGVDNIHEFAAMESLVAVIGGIHTPVAMAELEAIHEHNLLYLSPWAAGTFIVENDYNPNFVFRVSVRDEYAGDFLINAAFERGFQSPALLLWQTFSFFEPPFPDRAEQVLEAYCKRFDGCDGPASVPAPNGTAHAYDLVHLLARAIDAAGTLDRDRIREALVALDRHDGLIRRYEPPFKPGHQDALGPDDFRLAAYDENGVIIPLNPP